MHRGFSSAAVEAQQEGLQKQGSEARGQQFGTSLLRFKLTSGYCLDELCVFRLQTSWSSLMLCTAADRQPLCITFKAAEQNQGESGSQATVA